jgi:hypothetical protein
MATADEVTTTTAATAVMDSFVAVAADDMAQFCMIFKARMAFCFSAFFQSNKPPRDKVKD